MLMTETVQIVEIKQPFCTRSHGSAPCTASGTPCHNTPSTCQDPENFERGELSLFFSRGHVAERGVEGADYIIPSLKSVSTSPTKINFGAGDPDSQGLGNRAQSTVQFTDHLHSDRVVDPYAETRGGNPLEQGTFWGKWAARNLYRNNIEYTIYEGFAGQSLAEMSSRTFFADKLDGPRGGVYTITGRDILARLEARKAQCPPQSPGVLYTSIDASVTSFEVANAVEAEYPASGTLRVNNEVMTYTSRATSANGIEFTGVTRGTDDTIPAAHSFDDVVQECVRFENATPREVLTVLVRDYGNTPAKWLDDWSELDAYLSFYRLTRLITEPQDVIDLVSEVQEQCLCFLWWDERDKLIKAGVVRALLTDPPELTDAGNIVAGSFSRTEKPRERASQVWLSYGEKDPLNPSDRPSAFHRTFVRADPSSEEEDQHGEPQIRKVFSRWFANDNLAFNTTTKILRGHRDPPLEIRFRVHAKDRSLWTGDFISVTHFDDQDTNGAPRSSRWIITSAEETDPGHEIEYVCREVAYLGFFNTIQAPGAADYSPATEYTGRPMFIGDSNGLLSDGTPCGRIQ